jgi:hypothetical protein
MPVNAAVHGILGDALAETGRYGEAFAAFEHSVSLKPNAASYARISYARASSSVARAERSRQCASPSAPQSRPGSRQPGH